MAGKRKRYSDDFRASVVLMLQAAGYPEVVGALSRVATEVKVPARTISRWYRSEQNPPPDDLVKEKKIDFLEAIDNELAGIFEEMKTARKDADYRTLGTVAGILFDKKQLLSGKPTERIEQIDGLTDDERAARVAAIFNAARARRT